MKNNIYNIDKRFKDALLDTIPCAVFMVNMDNVIIFWNKSAQELTGYTEKEIVGNTCDKLRLSICSQQNPAVRETFCPILSNGKGGQFECEMKRKDGSIVPIMRKSRPVYDEQDNLIGAIEAFVDVSLIKKARTEIRLLKHEIAQRGKYYNLIGSSKPMRKLYEMIEVLARTDANIVIEGKTGTGKELIAKTIHAQSPRSEDIFLPINCGALPETLLEAELFGHVKGAFTGAVSDRAGCFETAAGGTLFLDEIAEISLQSQVKLLRVLQERQITRVGDSLPRPVDVRIIAASNKNLADMVKQGKFREDLYYRLRVVALTVPPLKERKDDISDLLNHFTDLFNKKYKKNINSCSPKAMDILISYDWPGNVRELEHAIEHAFVVSSCDTETIEVDALPPEIINQRHNSTVNPDKTISIEDEKAQIKQVLSQTRGNKSAAARILGITRAGLYKKIQRLGL